MITTIPRTSVEESPYFLASTIPDAGVDAGIIRAQNVERILARIDGRKPDFTGITMPTSAVDYKTVLQLAQAF